MLGVLTSEGSEPTYAPSTAGGDVPVAGVGTVVRITDAMADAGVDEIRLAGVDPSVRTRLRERRAGLVAGDAATAPVGSEHDRVLCAPTTAVAPPAALATLARRAPAVLCRPAESLDPLTGPERRPVSVTVEALDGRPPTAAPSVARELGDALGELERDHVADVRRPWELLDATEWCLAGTDDPDGAGLDGVERDLAGDVHPDAEVDGPVVVREGATVRSGAVVEGPTLVMPGAEVGPNCYVRANSFVSSEVDVGAAVEIKNSVLLPGAKVPHLSYVGDSVVGPATNVGAGSLVANLRHDEESITLTHAGRRVDTGRRKFGVVVGERAKLGIGTRLNVGVVVGPEATTDPGEVVRRDKVADE